MTSAVGASGPSAGMAGSPSWFAWSLPGGGDRIPGETHYRALRHEVPCGPATAAPGPVVAGQRHLVFRLVNAEIGGEGQYERHVADARRAGQRHVLLARDASQPRT